MAQASRKLSRGEKKLFLATNAVVALLLSIGVWRSKNDAIPELLIPNPSPPQVNAFDTYAAAGKLLANPLRISEVSDDTVAVKPSSKSNSLDLQGAVYRPAQLSERVSITRANATAIKLFRSGLNQEYREPPVRSFSALLPHLSWFDSLARLQVIQGQIHAARGETGDALRCFVQTMEFSAQISRGGSAGIWTLRVGSRCEHFGQRELLKILPELNSVQLRWLIQHIERMEESRRPLADVLREEKWTNQASIIELYGDKRWPQFLTDMIAGGCVPSADLQGIARVRLTGKGGILREYSHALDSAILESAQPYKKRRWRNNSSDVTYGLQPDFKNAAFIDALPRARARMIQTVAGLRLYHLKKGRYPANLSTLLPRYIKHVPLDPYDGLHSLRYKSSTSKYLLYSIGPDGKDDNGKPLKSDGTILGYSADSKGDIVTVIDY